MGASSSSHDRVYDIVEDLKNAPSDQQDALVSKLVATIVRCGDAEDTEKCWSYAVYLVRQRPQLEEKLLHAWRDATPSAEADRRFAANLHRFSTFERGIHCTRPVPLCCFVDDDPAWHTVLRPVPYPWVVVLNDCTYVMRGANNWWRCSTQKPAMREMTFVMTDLDETVLGKGVARVDYDYVIGISVSVSGNTAQRETFLATIVAFVCSLVARLPQVMSLRVDGDADGMIATGAMARLQPRFKFDVSTSGWVPRTEQLMNVVRVALIREHIADAVNVIVQSANQECINIMLQAAVGTNRPQWWRRLRDALCANAFILFSGYTVFEALLESDDPLAFVYSCLCADLLTAAPQETLAESKRYAALPSSGDIFRWSAPFLAVGGARMLTLNPIRVIDTDYADLEDVLNVFGLSAYIPLCRLLSVFAQLGRGYNCSVSCLRDMCLPGQLRAAPPPIQPEELRQLFGACVRNAPASRRAALIDGFFDLVVEVNSVESLYSFCQTFVESHTSFSRHKRIQSTKMDMTQMSADFLQTFVETCCERVNHKYGCDIIAMLFCIDAGAFIPVFQSATSHISDPAIMKTLLMCLHLRPVKMQPSVAATLIHEMAQNVATWAAHCAPMFGYLCTFHADIIAGRVPTDIRDVVTTVGVAAALQWLIPTKKSSPKFYKNALLLCRAFPDEAIVHVLQRLNTEPRCIMLLLELLIYTRETLSAAAIADVHAAALANPTELFLLVKHFEPGPWKLNWQHAPISTALARHFHYFIDARVHELHLQHAAAMLARYAKGGGSAFIDDCLKWGTESTFVLGMMPPVTKLVGVDWRRVMDAFALYTLQTNQRVFPCLDCTWRQEIITAALTYWQPANNLRALIYYITCDKYVDVYRGVVETRKAVGLREQDIAAARHAMNVTELAEFARAVIISLDHREVINDTRLQLWQHLSPQDKETLAAEAGVQSAALPA